MRTKNSFRNIYMSIITQIILTLLGFISRKVFIDNLGAEYLGVNGLLTNVLSMMSLVEGGIGTSIVYNLYKPLAEGDEEKVTALVQLYKKIYGIISIVIFILSLMLYPFLGYLMKESNGVSRLGLVYFIFVFRNILSYLNAHKWSLIGADQKAYVLAKNNLIFNIITVIAKIIILITTKNYILYLVIEVGIVLIQCLYNGKIVNERYPYINVKKKYDVDTSTKQNLISNVKALFLHNVGTWCVFGTDNILISAFINITTVGIYSNYTMVMGQLSSVLNPMINGIGSSVGNLIATENEEKKYSIFNVIYLINFWIYSFAAIFLFNLLEPFINWWLGYGLLFDKVTFFVILLNFYITGLRLSVNMFKSKAGIFVQDKYIPLIESAVNLVASLILVKYLGIVGVFIGTTISTICMPFWIQPKLIYKFVFNKSVKEYFRKYVLYVVITLVTGILTMSICNFIAAENFMGLVAKGIVCLVIPNTIYLLLFYKTDEFQYLYTIGKGMIGDKFKTRIGRVN